MARRLFYSFHYQPDNSRASLVRTMGVVEGNQPATDNDWEKVTGGGDAAIKKWIADQMDGKSCVGVLIGSETANRKWINHEIKKAWADRRGLFGVYIHKLKNLAAQQSTMGANPFDSVSVPIDGEDKTLSKLVKAYNPPYADSKEAYGYIKDNLSAWIEAAIKTRDGYPK